NGYKALCELRDELAPGADVPLQLLSGIPDLFTCSVEREWETLREASRVAFCQAVGALDAMREREGKALRDDIARRLESIRRLAKSVEERAPFVLETYRKRLKERAERLRNSEDIDVDAARLEQEIAVFAERVDICEELTRLES